MHVLLPQEAINLISITIMTYKGLHAKLVLVSLKIMDRKIAAFFAGASQMLLVSCNHMREILWRMAKHTSNLCYFDTLVDRG